MTLRCKWVNQARIVCWASHCLFQKRGNRTCGWLGQEEILTSVFSVLDGKHSGGISWESGWEKKPGGDFKDARKNWLLPKAILHGDTHTHMCTCARTHARAHTHTHTSTHAWNPCLNPMLLRQIVVSQPMFRPSWNHSFDRKKNHPKGLTSWGSWLHLFHNFT